MNNNNNNLLPQKRFIRELTAEWINRRYYGNNMNQTMSQQFIQRLLHELNRMSVYEDSKRQEAAKRLIPENILKLKEDEVEFVKALLKWFKQDFFKWVNELECLQCKIKCKCIGTTTPSTMSDELLYGASRVELYKCPQCFLIQRFPRYNDPFKLLETRKGRCGEWANCFLLFLKSSGLKVDSLRYILDLTDHVWVEYYSPSQKRWIHLDPCEQAYDSPLMYEVGWGKKLTYVFGFTLKSDLSREVSVAVVEDVSKRYTRDYIGMVMRRVGLVDYRIVREFLRKQFETWSEEGRLRRLREEEELEQRLDSVDLMKDGLKKEELLGRQSGSVEWRKARGEIGASLIITEGQEKEEMEMFKKSLSGMKRMKFSSGGGGGDGGGGEWKLNGTARIQHQNDGMLLLTPAKNDCVGSAFYLKEKIDLKKSFRIGFSFRINGNQNGGADGMAFVLQQETSTAATSTMGQGGSGLGYHGLKGRAVAVEIDTYASVDRCNDPNSNHISVQQGPVIGKEFQLSSHHDYSVAVCEQLPSLNNGSRYFVVVEYLSQKDEFNVYFTDSAEEKDYVRIIRIEKAQSKIVLLQQQEQNCWFGFTAATGGLCQEHLVLDFCYEQY